MDVLSKESLESRQDVASVHFKKPTETANDFQASCGFLIELYKDGDLRIHFHLYRVGDQPSTCIIVHSETCVISDDHSFRVPDTHTIEQGRTRTREQNASVFIDVGHFVQDVKNGLTSLCPLGKVVRLQGFDDCDGVIVNPKQSPVLLTRLSETAWQFTYGKCSSFGGFTVVGRYKFPHKIIENGSEVLQDIACQKPNNRGDFFDRDRNPGIIRDCLAGSSLAQMADRDTARSGPSTCPTGALNSRPCA